MLVSLVAFIKIMKALPMDMILHLNSDMRFSENREILIDNIFFKSVVQLENFTKEKYSTPSNSFQQK